MFLLLLVTNMIWNIVVLAVGFPIGISAWESTWIDTDMKEKGAQDALWFAVDEYNHRFSHTFLRQVYRVLGAEVQTKDVFGWNYKFALEMGENTCIDGTTSLRINSTDCVVPDDLQLVQIYKCRFGVWSQTTANLTELPSHWLTSLSCDKDEEVNL